MFRLHIKSRFAAFRTFHTGSFRPTADFMTHSAAYGLLLNLAGIETRYDDGKSPMTLMRDDLPRMRIAVGAVGMTGQAGEMRPVLPQKATVFQQLHNYPVGASGKEHAPNTKGSKYNITPVRRELLAGFEAILDVDADAQLEDRVLSGLAGELPGPRYGLPFLGDNAFFPDWIRPQDRSSAVFWLRRIQVASEVEDVDRVIRLTQWIDRADSSNTRSHLFALSSKPTRDPTEDSCIMCPPV